MSGIKSDVTFPPKPKFVVVVRPVTLTPAPDVVNFLLLLKNKVTPAPTLNDA